MFALFLIFCIVLAILAFIMRAGVLSRIAPGLGIFAGALLGLAYSGDTVSGAVMGLMAAAVYILLRVAVTRP